VSRWPPVGETDRRGWRSTSCRCVRDGHHGRSGPSPLLASARWRLEAVLLHPVDERVPRDPELLGSLGLATAARFEHGGDRRALHVGDLVAHASRLSGGGATWPIARPSPI